MVGHTVKCWPGHDLKKIAIDGRRNAVCWRRNGQSCGTGWMDVIEICALPQDLLKLLKRVASFRPPSLIRSQVARDNVWTNIRSIFRGRIAGTWGHSRTEVRASGQVSGRVDFLRLAEVWVPAIGVIEVW